MNEMGNPDGSDNSFDDVDAAVIDSLRRRGAAAKFGDAMIADVTRRVTLRRRRFAGAVIAAVAVPVFVGVAFAARADGPQRVDSNAELPADPPDSGAGDTRAQVPADAAPIVTGVGAQVWRCLGDGEPSGDGWTVFPYCELLCTPLITDTSTTTVVGAPNVATTVPERVDTTSLEPSGVTATVAPATSVPNPSTTVLAVSLDATTSTVPVNVITTVIATPGDPASCASSAATTTLPATTVAGS